ncbi:MAG: flavodoxin family protein [Deltaproteobacteria bacterium]|nr:flavodoxin family protein [Deltaproteobacteria bacterium]MBW2016560.1 flavodoxin family protein [Deltaproteobacteria bacterium]MBW2129325.1 flavodoxin family protein [Deltaproteobacteria bacterium]MBW2303286.1 flavodoxin family protein [Deltaproteobacteria bacterium]
MKVLGIYGSPRKGGNSDRLLDEALEGAASRGAEITRVYCRDLKMSGCLECGGCDKTGKCIVKDDMQEVYPLLEEAEAIFLASPIFFYGLTAQAKALIDRCQALWNKRMLKKPRGSLRVYEGGRGYLIAVGATRGKNLFEGAQLTAKYFYDALDMQYEGGIFFRRLEKKTAVEENPETLQEALNLGRKVAGP